MHRSTSIRRFSLLPLLVTTLVACSSPPQIPTTDQIAPTRVAVAPSATTQPTATIEPTQTSEPTATTAPTVTIAPTLEPTPNPDVSRVTGAQTFARGAITQRPWMVMIDNHPDAYPQSGMNQASMVFEGLAEYGVTRFIALYQDRDDLPSVDEIGPVRSTRLYFAQWAMGFHPVYAHAGGSPDGVHLAETTDQLTNFEALQLPGYTWRDTNRLAPHNLYTSSTLLRQFAQDQRVRPFDDQTVGYLFDTIPAASTIEASSINYYFLDHIFRAGWTYDPLSNGYHRTMRDQAHVDRVTGEQLWTRNLVVMQVNEAARLGDDKQRIDQEVIGSGAARVFFAGRNIAATWRKDSEATSLRFYDDAGQEIVFNAGPIWVAAIPGMDHLTAR